MMKDEIQNQGSAAWHSYREGKITSTMASIILGISPFMTPFMLWKEKLGLLPPKEENDHMRRGKLLEPIARTKFIKQTGINMIPKVVEHLEFPWIIASLDGISEDNEVLEIKCPSYTSTTHQLALKQEIENFYYAQIQHHLMVCASNKAYFYSYTANDQVIIEVKRNEEYIDDLFYKEQEFYNCMITMVPPPLTDKDYVERKDSLWTDLANEYTNVDTQLEALQERKDVLRNMLIISANKQSCRGAGIKVQHQYRKGNIDYAELVKKHNIDPEPYRKESTEYWRIIND